MPKSIAKIALSRSRDIPFNRLVLSQANVRRIKAGVSIEELAEDIARRTLLQSLTVRPILDDKGAETGMFEVPAGGRRFRALELLVKQKRLARTGAVSEDAPDADSAAAVEAAPEPAEEDDGVRPIPDRLVTELTAHRTLALRDALAKDPDIAFVAALHALCLRLFYRYGLDSCLALRMGRLRTLERLGLAGELEPGVWRIAPETDTTLRRMGERGDIIRTVQRDLAHAGLVRNPADLAIFDPSTPGARVVGRIVAEGVADEIKNHQLSWWFDGEPLKAVLKGCCVIRVSFQGIPVPRGDPSHRSNSRYSRIRSTAFSRPSTAGGLANGLQDRRYLIVDGVDGRAHYVDFGVLTEAEPTLSPGLIVEIRGRNSAARTVDRTIAAVAAEHAGVYSATAHRAMDRTASDEHIATHVRRLEALRRKGLVERTPDGEWTVGRDYLERAARYEAHQRSRTPVGLAVLSWRPLNQLPAADGATWLDRQLTAASPEAMRAAGFGAEVETALNRRRQWLLDQGFGREAENQIVYARNLLATLQRRELARAGARLAQETGLDYVEAVKGKDVRGAYRRSIALASGRFAVIEHTRELTLVPWRPALERARGRSISGILGDQGLSFSIGSGAASACEATMWIPLPC